MVTQFCEDAGSTPARDTPLLQSIFVTWPPLTSFTMSPVTRSATRPNANSRASSSKLPLGRDRSSPDDDAGSPPAESDIAEHSQESTLQVSLDFYEPRVLMIDVLARFLLLRDFSNEPWAVPSPSSARMKLCARRSRLSNASSRGSRRRTMSPYGRRGVRGLRSRSPPRDLTFNG